MKTKILPNSKPPVDIAVLERIDAACDQFDQEIRSGKKPRIEDHLARFEPAANAEQLLSDLLSIEIEYQIASGSTPSKEEYVRRFPEHTQVVQQCVENPTRSQKERVEPGFAENWQESLRKQGYELCEEIARGGMGVVFKAEQPALGRTVAIKAMLSGPQASDSEINRFFSEAKSVAKLQHDRIVKIFDVGECGQHPFFSMEFVEGGSLAQHTGGNPIPGRTAADYVAEIAKAIHFAHEHGVLHRDIKLSNILMDNEGCPKVTDFGLAKHIDGSAEITASGAVLGTPGYMPPEQARGEIRSIDVRSDVYSLGALLYALLVGRPPFQAESSTATLIQVMENEPPSPRLLNPAVSRDLETICLKCLEKDRDNRYSTADELAKDLSRYLNDEPIKARPPGRVGRLWRWSKRKPWAASLYATVVVSVVAVCAAYVAIAKADRTQKRADLRQRFQIELDQMTANPVALKQAADLLGELDQIDGKSFVDTAKLKLVRKFKTLLLDEFSNGNLNGRQLSAITETLREYANRWSIVLELDPAIMDRRWHNLFPRLESPFDAKTVTAVLGSGVSCSETKLLIETGPDQRLTSYLCQGDFRCTIKFGSDWRNATRLGVVLAGMTEPSSKGGYEFLIRPNHDGTAVKSFADSFRQKGTCVVEIRRRGRLLRKQTFPSSSFSQSQLPFHVTKVGRRISVQVGKQPPLPFDESFAVRGTVRFGVFGSNVSVDLLHSEHRTAFRVASALTQGDEFVGAGRYQRAADFYAAFRDKYPRHQEAAFKQAFCYFQMKDFKRAEPLFQGLANEGDSKWRLLGACHLWLLHLNKNSFSAARGILTTMAGESSYEDLALVVPAPTLRTIIDRSKSSTEFGYPQLRSDPNRVHLLEHMVSASRLLAAKREELFIAEMNLSTAYRLEDREDEARRILEGILNKYRLPKHRIRMAKEYSLVMLRLGKAGQALPYLNQVMSETGSLSYELVPSNARLLAALGKWELAAEALQSILAKSDKLEGTTAYVQACLLRGLVYDRPGSQNSPAAQLIWKTGFLASRKHDHPDPRAAGILGSLTAEMNATDLKTILARATAKQTGSFMKGLIATFAVPWELSAEVYRNIWRRKAAKQGLYKLRFGKMKFSEQRRISYLFIGNEISRRLVLGTPEFSAKLSPDQEKLLSEFTQGTYLAWSKRQITDRNVVEFYLIYAGVLNLKSWLDLSKRLKRLPKVRGPMAYILGCHFLHNSNTKKAKVFFESAQSDSQPQSRLHNLAAAKLKEISSLPKK